MPSKPVGSPPAPRMTRELPKTPLTVAADDPAFSRASAFVRDIQPPVEPAGEEATPRPAHAEPQPHASPAVDVQIPEPSAEVAALSNSQPIVSDTTPTEVVAHGVPSSPPKRTPRAQPAPVIADRDRFVMGGDANKTTVYPTDEFKRRLREIATTHRVGEAMVIGYALHRMFSAMTDDEIVAPLKAMGYGMRRPRP